MQPTTITLSPAEAAIIYFHNIATPTPPTPTIIKISSKEQIKIKFDTALRQKYDQSPTVWWSKRSSTRN